MGLGVAGIAVLLGLDVEGIAPLPLLAVALVVVGYATAPLVVSRALPDVLGVAASAVALTVPEIGRATCRGESVDIGGRSVIKIINNMNNINHTNSSII